MGRQSINMLTKTPHHVELRYNDLASRIIKDNIDKIPIDTYLEKQSKQIETLQEALAKERDAKNELIFWFIFFGVMVFDALAFRDISAFSALLLVLLELVGLPCLAIKFGQERALQLLMWLKNLIENRFKGPSSH